MIDAAVVAPLLASHWYDAAADLISDSETDADPASLRRARDLALCAKRVLDLDAEDFDDLARELDRPWGPDLAACAFPRLPRDENRGALASLVPLYRLMLEALNLRMERREPMLLMVTAHLIGEYLPQLAWETRLGHGGDPARLAESVGEKWGTGDKTCSHTFPQRAAAKRALHAASGDTEGFTAYLDRFHSRQGNALAVCAMNHATVQAGQRPESGPTCAKPCGWARQGTEPQRSDLDARCRLALLYQESPLVALRHHAPVGHFFGVPSLEEITHAWDLTWERVSAPWPDGANPLGDGVAMADVALPGEALPGMAALVSAVAGMPLAPGDLIRRIGADAAQVLADA